MPQLLHKQIYILRPTAGAKMEAAEKKKRKKTEGTSIAWLSRRPHSQAHL